jgi:CheY-like chemotaxis protein
MKKITILLVDDNETEQLFNKFILEDEFEDNIVLHQVYDGLEALETLEKGLEPDCILLDINMPRMNAFELLDVMKSKSMTANTVIMLSSTLIPEEKEKAKSYSFVKDFFNKPLNDEKIKRLKEIVGL